MKLSEPSSKAEELLLIVGLDVLSADVRDPLEPGVPEVNAEGEPAVRTQEAFNLFNKCIEHTFEKTDSIDTMGV